MRLTDTINKIKSSVSYSPDLSKDLFIIALILLVAIGSFMLGRLSFLDEKHNNKLKIIRTEPLAENNSALISSIHGAIPLQRTNEISPSQEASPGIKVGGMYVGSRSGKIFYLPWCSGAKRILEKNKIWFKDASDAISKGYKPSSSCKGI